MSRLAGFHVHQGWQISGNHTAHMGTASEAHTTHAAAVGGKVATGCTPLDPASVGVRESRVVDVALERDWAADLLGAELVFAAPPSALAAGRLLIAARQAVCASREGA